MVNKASEFIRLENFILPLGKNIKCDIMYENKAAVFTKALSTVETSKRYQKISSKIGNLSKVCRDEIKGKVTKKLID